MAKKKPQKARKTISNRRARHDYDLDGGFVVGLQLTGAETKSLRRGHGHIRGAYVTVKESAKASGELWLINATITGDAGIKIDEQQQTRARKLLAKRKEIDQLIAAKQQGQTIVPTDILTGGRYIKLRIAVGRGKKRYDKRQALKERTASREAARSIKLG